MGKKQKQLGGRQKISDPAGDAMNAKSKAVLHRIELLEQAICKAKEYLENGQHAEWSGFRPLFVRKRKDGQEQPPHKDWVKNVFLPRMEKSLRRAERIMEQLSCENGKHRR